MKGGPLIRIPARHQVRIERNGPKIAFLLDGKLVFDADWREAQRVAEGIMRHCLAARQEERVLTGKATSP